jgi:uncharacterized membrane protein YeaQ/YmgE (transglycosylase-associated protein family)
LLRVPTSIDQRFDPGVARELRAFGRISMFLMRLWPRWMRFSTASRAIVRGAQAGQGSRSWDSSSGRFEKNMGIISWLVVGAIAGYLAGFLVKGDEGMGVIGHIVLGIVGALVGGFLAGVLTGGNDYISGINITTIVVAVIGAVIAVVAWNAIQGRSRTGRGPV